jgi:membrane protein
MLLALFPALTALVSLYGLGADPATINNHLSLLQGVMPDEAIAIITEQITRLTQASPGALSMVSFSGSRSLCGARMPA